MEVELQSYKKVSLRIIISACFPKIIMSVVGLDIGNENCAIAVAKRGGIDVLLNDESKRETPAVVSFGEKQRFLGSAGAAFTTTNPKSTISQIKRMIGKLYNDPSVQEDLRLLPFDTSESSHGGILIHVKYLSKIWTFKPVDILGMLFAHLKKVIEKNTGSPVIDCVIGIPSYFTDFQRREYLNAIRTSEESDKPLMLMFRIYFLSQLDSVSMMVKTKDTKSIILFQKAFHFHVTRHFHTMDGLNVIVSSSTPTTRASLLEYHLILIGPSQPPIAEKVVLKVKMHLNINGIVEIESALLILEDKNLDKTLTDRKHTGSSLSTSHYTGEARKGWVRRQNVPVSKNLNVVITKDELNVVQRRLQMFEEHDIKVEKTKEIRNILESFIYDTRTKFQSSYRSVTTDSEAEEIIKRLQGTEDWLYEDGDDESEQVYIGKLEDLKKLLHPIENRYKDETARKEVTKALHTCIQENRFPADSLPPSHKKEVIDKCTQSEWWLTNLSKLQDSLAKNATPSYCSSAISGIMQAFRSRYKAIMRSKPSLPKCNESVDSDRKRDPDGMLTDC
ncbi:unnamed protein product [Lactuca saligna]|uniref:Heat shock protein 70 n=1 Tax=Lactuca saligna TaxID=75948 RepID=A0AA35Z0A9_LACSI|nr:unnamed protein product [Lactuca saligna]